MNREKYLETMKKINDGKISVIDGSEVPVVKESVAFRWIKAARECQGSFAGDPAVPAVLRCLIDHIDNTTGETFVGNDTIAHETCYSSPNTISNALARLELTGIINIQRRMDKSNKTTINLTKLRKFRYPVQEKWQKALIERLNKYCTADTAPLKGFGLTYNHVLEMQDGDIVWDVLSWYADRIDSGNPILTETKWDASVVFRATHYPLIRACYFKAIGKDEPKLDWPEKLNDRYEMFYGEPCRYCQWRHGGACDPDRVKVVKKMEKAKLRCKKRLCRELMEPGVPHTCSNYKETISDSFSAEMDEPVSDSFEIETDSFSMDEKR